MQHIATELDVDGRLLRGNVRKPEGEGPFPTVVFLHGFTVWKTGPNRLYEDFVRLAVPAGFCVVRYDFYGTGESEGEFYEMTIGNEMKETEAIFAWTKKLDYVDSNNIFLAGHSMGGQVAALTAPKLQPKGLIAWAPALTMLYQAGMRCRTMHGPTERGWDIEGLELSREFMEECGKIDMHFCEMASGYEGPVLLIHGTNDMAIPVESSSYSLKSLYGDKCEALIIEGADHRFLSLEWKKTLYNGTIDFMKKHLN